MHLAGWQGLAKAWAEASTRNQFALEVAAWERLGVVTEPEAGDEGSYAVVVPL